MSREARWCEQHGRLECAKRKHGGGQCHGRAITGTDACRFHVGKTVARARRDALTAWAASLGDDGISPRLAVAAQLGLAWRRAGLLGEELRRQVEAANDDGTPGGLVGHTYGASAAAGGIYPTGERARALVELERAERELVVRFAETGHKMGIEDARVRLAEEDASALIMILVAALRALGLDPHDGEVRDAVAAALHQFAARQAGR
jgi:hypothetical protein